MINEELLIERELRMDILSDEEQVDEREDFGSYSKVENYDEEKYITKIMEYEENRF